MFNFKRYLSNINTYCKLVFGEKIDPEDFVYYCVGAGDDRLYKSFVRYATYAKKNKSDLLMAWAMYVNTKGVSPQKAINLFCTIRVWIETDGVLIPSARDSKKEEYFMRTYLWMVYTLVVDKKIILKTNLITLLLPGDSLGKPLHYEFNKRIVRNSVNRYKNALQLPTLKSRREWDSVIDNLLKPLRNA